jgi:hypothetical protein
MPRSCYAILAISISMALPCASASPGEPQKLVELVIPLNRDGAYSLRAFCRECNDKLKTDYPLVRPQA